MKKLFVLICGMASLNCTAIQRQDTEKALAQVLVSDEQEFQLGLQVHEELQKQNTKFTENPALRAYVQTLALKLIGQADRERKLDWRWYLIDDPNTINAFATPGGRIYIYTGLLLAAESEAEVLGVLGHEIGHVVARHSARQLVAAKGLETVAAMALGKSSGDVAQLAAGLAGKGAMLAYGRDMELEADQYGARFSSGAGYNPRGLATFFEKLKAKYGDTGPVLQMFSTHPSNSERISRILAYIGANGLNGTEEGVIGIKSAQAILGKK
jgi:beta-barrel assembly-enhancing protease